MNFLIGVTTPGRKLNESEKERKTKLLKLRVK